MKLMLKGERCFGPKCAIQKRGANYPPGMQGWKRQKKVSEYGMQLRERQRLKRMFGILDRQFRCVFTEAQRKTGNTGTHLIQLVSRRLDYVVRMAGFGYGPASARQVVAHGLVRLNGRRVDRPSMIVKAGDVITFTDRENSRALIKKVLEATKAYQEVPGWLERDETNLSVKVLNLPSREEFPFEIREKLIVEGASK
jgi:small subunit ribosomal protein S4